MTVDLDRLKKLSAAATPGPWNYEAERYSAQCVIGVKPLDDRWIAHCQPNFNGEENGLFIVEMRNSLDPLIARLEAAEKVVEDVKAEEACLASADTEAYLQHSSFYEQMRKSLAAYDAVRSK